MNERTTEPMVELLHLAGRECLFYRVPGEPNVAIIRGTSADEDGYVSMEHEATTREDISIAQAVHNAGGIVICQVKRIVQRANGELTIGDTHAYDEPFDFALCEDPSVELLARAERLLGTTLPPVARRWEGVYAQCVDGDICLREEIHPGVWTVTGPGGRGMTCAPAIAADTLRAAGAVGVAA